jgi:hypothetical protein
VGRFRRKPHYHSARWAGGGHVTATYNSGDSYDVSSDPSTVWTSSDPTVILAGNGVLTGLTNGTATVTATYTGVTGTNTVTVVDPAFVDDINTSKDLRHEWGGGVQVGWRVSSSG